MSNLLSRALVRAMRVLVIAAHMDDETYRYGRDHCQARGSRERGANVDRESAKGLEVLAMKRGMEGGFVAAGMFRDEWA